MLTKVKTLKDNLEEFTHYFINISNNWYSYCVPYCNKMRQVTFFGVCPFLTSPAKLDNYKILYTKIISKQICSRI